MWYKYWVWLVVLCKRESVCCCLTFSLFVPFSFSPIKHFVSEFSAPITGRVFKFYIHVERGQVYCEKENQDSVINFALFFLFSISHSSVVHREICVKDFSGTTGTVPRILKFGTNACCIVWKRISLMLLIIALFAHFSFSPSKFSVTNSFYESQSLQILYTHWEWPSILLDRKRNWH